jgi:DNA primase
VVDLVAHDHDLDGPALRERLGAGPFAALLTRLEAQIEAAGHWPATPAASDRDAEEGWLQALTLHRRKRTLHKELKDAEAALAREPSDANLARLVDIQQELAKSEGTEALIEGFGSSSGRQARIF